MDVPSPFFENDWKVWKFYATKIIIVEKFLILSGKGIIRFKNINNNDKNFSYEVDGKELKVVDIPPGYTHSIENISNEEMIVLFWASEIFDSNIPDTDYFPV